MDALLNEALKVLPVGQVVVLLLMAFIIKVIKEIRDELKDMSGSTKVLQQWCRDHEQIDLTRHHELRSDVSELRGIVIEGKIG